ncbi:MAG: DUF2612 domain-containing protein [Burkholderiaceae bacterium]|jgi:hypothetical protein|nr:DUF2612 domain-containing protein [Burkholderiaceae bacterium]
MTDTTSVPPPTLPPGANFTLTSDPAPPENNWPAQYQWPPVPPPNSFAIYYSVWPPVRPWDAAQMLANWQASGYPASDPGLNNISSPVGWPDGTPWPPIFPDGITWDDLLNGNVSYHEVVPQGWPANLSWPTVADQTMSNMQMQPNAGLLSVYNDTFFNGARTFNSAEFFVSVLGPNGGAFYPPYVTPVLLEAPPVDPPPPDPPPVEPPVEPTCPADCLARQTVISQYANSPILLQLVCDMHDWLDTRADFDAFYETVWNIDTAAGFGLDIWGRIVGVSRNIEYFTPDPNLFGFENTGFFPFNQAPFRHGSGKLANYETLDDDSYRTLIMVKAMANITLCAAPVINQLLQSLFAGRGRCYCIDEGDMAMHYVFEFDLQPYELVIMSSAGVFPHPAGVFTTLISVDPSATFGFKGSLLQPFNQGALFSRNQIADLS